VELGLGLGLGLGWFVTARSATDKWSDAYVGRPTVTELIFFDSAALTIVL